MCHFKRLDNFIRTKLSTNRFPHKKSVLSEQAYCLFFLNTSGFTLFMIRRTLPPWNENVLSMIYYSESSFSAVVPAQRTSSKIMRPIHLSTAAEPLCLGQWMYKNNFYRRGEVTSKRVTTNGGSTVYYL